MRTWTRAPLALHCGSCGGEIATGDPVCTIRLTMVSQPKRRCATCAGEPVPEVLPPVVQSIPFTPFLKVPSGANVLPFDWKRRSSGDREVGEEG